MRRLRTVLMLQVLFIAFAFEATAQDHLVPEFGTINEPPVEVDYMKRVRGLLFNDFLPDYEARVICLPFGGPPWAVTLRCEDIDPLSYSIEFVTRSRGDARRPKGDLIKAKAEIDPETASAIQAVWFKMLRAVRHPDEGSQLRADGSTFHFSRFVRWPSSVPGVSPGQETGYTWTPSKESPPGRLVSLGEAMRAYAQASKEERPKIAKQLRESARKLERDLSQPKAAPEKAERPR